MTRDLYAFFMPGGIARTRSFTPWLPTICPKR